MKIFKLTEIPEVLEADALYFIRHETEQTFTMFVTTTDGVLKPVNYGVTEEDLEFLSGFKMDKEPGKALVSNDFTDAALRRIETSQEEATRNDPDAKLRDRQTHTGLDSIADIQNLNKELSTRLDMYRARIATDSIDLASRKTSIDIKTGTVYNWTAFSHGATQTFPYDNIGTFWTFSGVTHSGSSYAESFNGRVSPWKTNFYDYTLSVTSQGGEDNALAFLIGFVKDPTTGKETTLSAVRDPGGIGYLWAIVLNLGQGAAYGERLVATGRDSVYWGNGASGSDSLEDSGYVPGDGQPWGSLGGVRMRVSRTPLTVDVWTTEFGATALDDATKISIDLTSSPDLYVFTGPCKFGVGAYKQSNAKFAVTTQDKKSTLIFSAADKVFHYNDAGTWYTSTDTVAGMFPTHGVIVDEEKDRVIYKDPLGVLSYLKT